MKADLIWSRNLFNSLRDGGTWGVPRSGLVFCRRGDALHLVTRIPFTDDMASAAAAGRDVPPDARALRAYQDADMALIRSRFEEAGIKIVDATVDAKVE